MEATTQPISVADRLARSLFVALAVGLCWAIRGTFGHVVGAMLPGAALGLGFAYVSGQRSLFRWMPIIGGVTGFLIAQGGTMSYGILHGYAKSDTFVNYAYGFFTLFLQGGSWGIFGCAAVGLLLERKPLREIEWASAVATVYASGFLFYTIVVTWLGFDVNPPRNNISVGYVGGAIGLLAWLALNKKPYGLRGAVFGFIGFGIGMSFGRVLDNVTQYLEWKINGWNIMEYFAGFFGGLIFTFGILGKRVEEPPAGHRLASVYGILYCLAGIVLLHRIRRVDQERLEEWPKRLASLGFDDPAKMSDTVLMLLNGVCVLGLVAALVWLFIFFRDKYSLRWFPVMALCGLGLLFENIYSLYFFEPHREGYIETRWLWWGSYALMALYALFARPREAMVADEVVDRVPWKRMVVFALIVYGLTLGLAAFVNGEMTMKSANTRWPVWQWREGPPKR